MVFEGADGTFGGVAAVNVGWDQLVFDVFCFHEVFDQRGAFIVEEVHPWFASALDESFVGETEGSDMFCFGSIFHGYWLY